jgi:hypothetical protein
MFLSPPLSRRRKRSTKNLSTSLHTTTTKPKPLTQNNNPRPLDTATSPTPKQNAGETLGDDEKAQYQLLIDAAKGDAPVKQLTAGFLPKFFHLFPAEAEPAINAMLDLCEDEKMQIRVKAIEGLVVLAKSTPANVARVADVFGQLLVTEEKAELAKVHSAFTSLFDIDVAEAFRALQQLITEAPADGPLKDKAIHFASAKHVKLQKASEEQQKAIATNLAAVLGGDGLSTKEFGVFINAYAKLPVVKTDEALAAGLADLIRKQAGLEGAFDAANAAAFVSGLHMAENKLKGDTHAFVTYFFESIAPVGSECSCDECSCDVILCRSLARSNTKLILDHMQLRFYRRSTRSRTRSRSRCCCKPWPTPLQRCRRSTPRAFSTASSRSSPPPCRCRQMQLPAAISTSAWPLRRCTFSSCTSCAASRRRAPATTAVSSCRAASRPTRAPTRW